MRLGLAAGQPAHPRVGELNANIDTLVQHQFPTLAAQFLGSTAPNAFTVHGDDAPTFYLAKKGTGGGQLAQNDPLNREFERSVADLTAVNQYTGATDKLMVAMADQAEMKLLHMWVPADPNRNASFTYFADPNYFLTDFPDDHVRDLHQPGLRVEPRRHPAGDRQHLARLRRAGSPERSGRPARSGPITRTSGRRCSPSSGSRTRTPTTAGRSSRSSTAMRSRTGSTSTAAQLQKLGAAYKQLTAPFGSVGMDSLKFATAAIRTGSSTDDAAYVAAEAKLGSWLTKRDQIAGQIRTLLNGLAHGGPAPSSDTIKSLTSDANDLIAEVHAAAP